MSEATSNGVIAQIQSLSSAEDFFSYFDLPYEKETLNVSRLHIMRRMGQYLHGVEMTDLSEDEVYTTARETLEKAYTDFTRTTPIQEKLFKVFRDQEKAQAGKFVDLDDLAVS